MAWQQGGCVMSKQREGMLLQCLCGLMRHPGSPRGVQVSLNHAPVTITVTVMQLESLIPDLLSPPLHTGPTV